ncbi:hypothetical protein JW930_00490 [Candidatus Woesearchaeota archaeon]|nr:hypothetical protein [Candidatus Woesearchaeota archaeon]
MPIYKYKCAKCGNIEELFCSYNQRKEKEKILECSKCNSVKLNPVFTKVLVSSKEREIPEEHFNEDDCSSCSGSKCNTCY